MELLQIRCGGDRNFSYLLLDSGEAAIMDPGEDPRDLLRALATRGARLRWVIATHTHRDHLAGLDQVPVDDWQLVASPDGAAGPDRAVPAAGLELPLGTSRLVLRPTPGHSPCSLCILVQDAAGAATDVLTGDTLFVGKVGGTSGEVDGRQEYLSLHGVLMALADSVRVWPGHDVGVGPSSTIGQERWSNPFLLCPDPESFLDLKAHWAEYKLRHGIQ